MTQAAKPDLN